MFCSGCFSGVRVVGVKTSDLMDLLLGMEAGQTSLQPGPPAPDHAAVESDTSPGNATTPGSRPI